MPEKWQPLTDEQISLNNKDPKPQKSWIYEKRSASLDMFVFNISLNLSPDKVIKVLWEENFSYADSTLYLDFQTKRIYSNKTSGRVDILIGHSDPKTYGCLFGTYYLEGKFVLFMFTCPHAEMPKLSGIINEMVASLEAW